ncbi:MAG: 2,3-cyclic 3-phosphodiesterase [Sphingomonadales bacterium]|nr:2,3-cyclic 3-phosphodiesterase [Sphingomonadales bacterium]
MNAASFIRYFLALRPEPPMAARIGQVRDSIGPLRSQVSNDRIHMTLGILAELPCPDERVAAAVKAMLSDHSLQACRVALGRLAVADGIATLLPAGGHASLRALQSGLFERLGRHGIDIRRPRDFRPHVTLGYGPRFSDRRTIRPIGWFADRIVLIESWVGRTVHHIVGSWNLLPPAQYELDFAE